MNLTYTYDELININKRQLTKEINNKFNLQNFEILTIKNNPLTIEYVMDGYVKNDPLRVLVEKIENSILVCYDWKGYCPKMPIEFFCMNNKIEISEGNNKETYIKFVK